MMLIRLYPKIYFVYSFSAAAVPRDYTKHVQETELFLECSFILTTSDENLYRFASACWIQCNVQFSVAINVCKPMT